MSKARVERRLAAILAADVAGYSRLIGSDEAGTVAALKAFHYPAHGAGIPQTELGKVGFRKRHRFLRYPK